MFCSLKIISFCVIKIKHIITDETQFKYIRIFIVPVDAKSLFCFSNFNVYQFTGTNFGIKNIMIICSFLRNMWIIVKTQQELPHFIILIFKARITNSEIMLNL